MIRLLIADDEKLEREALAELVQRRFERDVVLEVAENGRKAADTAVLWGADLILMDIEMPGMSGLDAARAVLAQRPSCRVIFVTAYSLFQYAHEAVHLGACDYLLKPVDPDELEASVRRAMRQIETERKLEELAAARPQPEQTETEAEAEDAPEEGENSQTALVMAHVRRYLEDNYMFDLSLDSVGEILHISPAYLSAQFKKYQKMNFLDCLTELRINAAKELLADPFRSSAEVASMVGYEDASSAEERKVILFNPFFFFSLGLINMQVATFTFGIITSGIDGWNNLLHICQKLIVCRKLNSSPFQCHGRQIIKTGNVYRFFRCIIIGPDKKRNCVQFFQLIFRQPCESFSIQNRIKITV